MITWLELAPTYISLEIGVQCFGMLVVYKFRFYILVVKHAFGLLKVIHMKDSLSCILETY